MKKDYPYLQDSYYENENSAINRRNFLKTIDSFVNQKQYVKITLLNWHEQPLKELEGEISGGTITLDGSSAMRRTCSLSATFGKSDYNIEDADMDFAINKKIFIEVGIKNYSTDKIYGKDLYPILWFPFGVYFIGGCNISSSASSGVNISLTLKDKMAGLTGDVGGTLPATVIFDEEDTQNTSGEYVSEKVLVYNIIQELVHHYGGEDLNRIVIEDVPLRIPRIMKWTGSMPLYLVPQDQNKQWLIATTEKPDTTYNVEVFTNGEDVGYINDDFVYPSELVSAPGESVVSVLDKIKSVLGNYEYFYDVFGVFHFREIKNYINTTQVKTLLDDMEKNDYLVEVTSGKSVYSFSDDENIISLNQNPKYENIKNDYIVQGLRQMTSEDVSYPVRYHLAIDNKPKRMNEYKNFLLYQEKDTNLIKPCFPYWVQTPEDLPNPGNFNVIYGIEKNKKFIYSPYEESQDSFISSTNFTIVDNTPDITEINAFVYWDGNKYSPIEPYKTDSGNICWWPKQDNVTGYIPIDWRTELYLQGLLSKNTGRDSSFYYTNIEPSATAIQDIAKGRVDVDFYFEELDAYWPQIYDLANNRFYAEEFVKNGNYLTPSVLTDGNFFLDFIDANESELGQFSIQNIGRRSDVVKNDDINCLFQPDIPNIVFINQSDEDRLKLQQECEQKGQKWTLVKPDVYWSLATGGYKNGAFDQIKYELYLHTNYQKTISITSLPVFYLEPNIRITVNDKTTNTYGDFIIQNISIPLGANSTMSISANECFERF